MGWIINNEDFWRLIVSWLLIIQFLTLSILLFIEFCNSCAVLASINKHVSSAYSL